MKKEKEVLKRPEIKSEAASGVAESLYLPDTATPNPLAWEDWRSS